VTKSAPYAALNLNYQTEQKKGPFDASIDVLRGLKDLADKTPEAQLGTTFQARGLGQFGSIEDFHRLKERSRSEIEDDIRHAQTDRRSLNISDPKAKAWEDLQVQLKRAGESIEKTLIVGLTNLAAPIGHLSDSVVHGIEAFASSDRLKIFIDEVADSLDGFASKIGTPEFDKSVTGFADGIGTLASNLRDDLPGITTVFNAIAAMGNVLGAIGGPLINGRPPDPDNPLPNDPGGAPAFKLPSVPPLFKFDPHKQPTPDFMPGGGSDYNPVTYRQSAGGSPLKIGERVNEAHDFFRFAGWSEAQTAGLLANIGAESGFNPGARNASGHVGLAQWDRNRAAQFRARYGHDVTAGSFEEQLDFVQYELTHGEKAAGDKLRAIGKADAAAKSIKLNYERAGTAGNDRGAAGNAYMQQFKDRSVQVTITNNTGGNVHVAATQLVGT
jgi:hypothetical protein